MQYNRDHQSSFNRVQSRQPLQKNHSYNPTDEERLRYGQSREQLQQQHQLQLQTNDPHLGQGRGRIQQRLHDTNNLIANRYPSSSKSHSTSNTPKRKGNPQSPHQLTVGIVAGSNNPGGSKSRSRSSSRSRSNKNQLSHHPSDNENDNDFSLVPLSSNISTPLSTLSALLTTTKVCHACALSSYRTCHKLHRDAKDRTQKARQALAVAQAEYEHATTAEEYAFSELQRASSSKHQCESHALQVENSVRKLSANYCKGKRVKLVGLTQNVDWNGRNGTIVKLVVEGEDCGRWKIKLDKVVRGKADPEGMDGTVSENCEEDVRHRMSEAEVNGGGDSSCGISGTNASHHVVAKAENLHLMEELDLKGWTAACPVARTRSRSRSKSRSSHSGSSRDPSITQNNEQTFKRRENSDNIKYDRYALVTPNSDVRLRQEPEDFSYNEEFMCHRYTQQEDGTELLSPPQVTPKRVTQGRNLTSAFSNMLMSPVSFEAVSFTPIPTNSFICKNDNSFQQQHIKRAGVNIIKSDNSIAGSFFDEVTLHEHSTSRYAESENISFGDHRMNSIEGNEMECLAAVGSFSQSYPREVYSSDLPTLVILPIDSDGLNGDSAPLCVGVQGAGVSHVNGVYLHANKQSNTDSPLYFKEGPPTLLEDDKYYDMCILRVDCPDSSEHVIWFLARVDIDPSCLDVKFSDCYYYCRLLSHTDNHEGDCSDANTNNYPPLSGWNIPNVPSGIAFAPSFSLSSHPDSANGSVFNSNEIGLGIEPRYCNITRDFASPGIESNTTKYSF